MTRFSGSILAVVVLALAAGFGGGYWVARNKETYMPPAAGVVANPTVYEGSTVLGGRVAALEASGFRLESPNQMIEVNSETTFVSQTGAAFDFSELLPGDAVFINLKEPFHASQKAVAVKVEYQGHPAAGTAATPGAPQNAAPLPLADPSKDPANTKPPAVPKNTVTPPPTP